MTKLMASAHIEINAPLSRVWQVLVKPAYINQWDDMPDDYDYRKELKQGSEIIWKQTDDRFTRLTVIQMDTGKIFRMALYKSGWDKELAPDAITYDYRLSEQNGQVKLEVTIGDFSKLPDGEKYQAAAQSFATEAMQKISTLALNKG